MNILPATITDVTTSEHISSISVAVGEDTFYLLLAETSNRDELLNTSTTLAFKETEVILQKSSLQVSSANTQKGIIEAIESGIVLTSITLTYHEISIGSLITTNTYKRLELTIGDEVVWMVQPSEISLLRGHDGV
ncbi:MAG: hypothetical protein PHV62_08375 [Sulfuricurvum sp.]|nr:hypothetical protein [Sulfuricurvum sp.]